MKNFWFILLFFQNTSKVVGFLYIPMIASKNHIRICWTTTSFYLKSDLKFVKNRFFLVKKMKNSGNFMFNRSSLRIFNPSRYIGEVDLLRRNEVEYINELTINPRSFW